MIPHPPTDDPMIVWNHVDGPLLICKDGTPHWLSLFERLMVRANMMTITHLDQKYNSDPQKG